MATESWAGIPLSGVSSTGVLTQLYPNFVTAGAAPSPGTGGTPTVGQLILRPTHGAVHSIQIRADGVNGGYVELWDLSGEDVPVDVSSSLPATITNAQLGTLKTAGLAKLLWSIDFAGSVGTGPVSSAGIYRAFMRGLAARFVNATPTGTCYLNMVVEGGFWKTESRGT